MKNGRAWRRRSLILLGLAAAYAIVGFWVLPPIVKSQLERRAAAQLGRKVSVETVRINPFAFSIALEGFAVREKDGAATFLGWHRLYVRANLLASIWRAWAASDIQLDGFQARVAIGPDKSFNFSDILATLAGPSAGASKSAEPGRPLEVGRMEVRGAQVDFSDRSNAAPFSTKWGPVSFTLTGFSTAPKIGAPYRFQASTDSGETFAWSGSVTASPPGSAGEFRIGNLDLPRYSPYYAERVGADLKSGKLTVQGRYVLDLAPGRPVMRLEGATFQLRDFSLVERASQAPIVDLPSVDVAGVDADALTRKAMVQNLTVNGGDAQVRRAADGSINLLALIPKTPAGEPASSAPGAAMPDIAIGEVAVRDFGVAVTDATTPRPAHLALNHIQLSIRNVSLAPKAVMPLSLAFDWAPQGAVRLEGSFGIQPVVADLKIDAFQVSFLPLSAYLEQFARARIAQGSVTTTLAVQASLPPGGSPAASVSGEVKVNGFGLVDGATSKPLAGCDSLAVTGLKAATAPELAAAINEIAVEGPYVRARVNPDHSVNLLTLFPQQPVASAPPPPEKLAAAPSPKIDIGKISISGGNFHFVDQSLEPNAAMDITDFGGAISGLSSTNLGKGEVDLKAGVGGIGQVAISGKLDPFGTRRSVDISIDTRNVDLVPLSPYSGKFAGYELARGKLKLAIHTKVNGNALDSTDVITLDGFTFGGAVPSPDATHLPVRLGVALLKDRDGKIVIDVPIQGTVGDPNFKIGRVVGRVIGNLLVKAATSPFSLLGSMFGGGGDELAYQEFEPGSAALETAQRKKLETVTKALTNRPSLNLALEGNYDAAADSYALKRVKLEDLVRREVWGEQHASNPNIPPPDQIAISPEQSAAMIKKLFDARFPPGTKFGTPLPPRPAVAEPPPPPQGFFQRVIAFITFQGVRDRHKARDENARRQVAYQTEVTSAQAAGTPLEEMTGRLAEIQVITPNDLLELAAHRAQTVRGYLVHTGHIGEDRLFLAKLAPSSKADRGPRVFLSLQ